MPFSRMMAWARAMRRSRSSTPMGGTSPRMFFMAASSASAVDPPTPTVITSPFQLSSPKPALYQDICRRRQPEGCRHQDERGGSAERPVVELKLSIDQGAHHLEFGAAEQHGCRISIHAEDEGEDRTGEDARQRQWQQHATKHRHRPGAEIEGGLLDIAIDAFDH